MLSKVLSKTSGIPRIVHWTVSPQLTLLISLAIVCSQILLIGIPMLYNLSWHFERLKSCNVRCIMSETNPKWVPPFCFLINMLQGLVIVPIFTGFIFWPLLLAATNLKLLLKGQKKWNKRPPYCRQIQEYQKKFAEYLIDQYFTKRKEAFVESLVSSQSKSKHPLPVEILDMILKQIEKTQDAELRLLKDKMRKQTRKIPRLDFLQQLSQWPDPFQSTTARYLVFVNHTDPNLSSSQEEIWYAVFSKDAAIFALLCLLQISFPYWLYHL